MGAAYGVKPITDTEIKKTFGENLKTLRKNKGLSRNELAQKFSLSALSIGTYERGLRIPTPQTLFAMADFFNVSMDELLGHGDFIPSRQVVIEEFRLKQAINYLLRVCNTVTENVRGEFFLEVPVTEENFSTDDEGIARRIDSKKKIIVFGNAADLVDFTKKTVQAALDSDKTFKAVFVEKSKNLFIDTESMTIEKGTTINLWGSFKIDKL